MLAVFGAVREELGTAGRRPALDEHDELVTTETGDRVAFAQRAQQSSGHRLEQLVARLVAEGVVHLLEAVEIHEQRRGLGAVAPGAGQHLLDPVEDERAVRQAGERVVQRLMADSFEQARVANCDGRLARDAAQPPRELRIVEHAFRPVEDVADHEPDPLVVHDDGDRRDRGRAQLADEQREHVQVFGVLAVPDGDGGVAGARSRDGDLQRAQMHVVGGRVAARRDDPSAGRTGFEQRDRGAVTADDGRERAGDVGSHVVGRDEARE